VFVVFTLHSDMHIWSCNNIVDQLLSVLTVFCKVQFSRVVTLALPGSTVSAWTTDAEMLFKGALEDAFGSRSTVSVTSTPSVHVYSEFEPFKPKFEPSLFDDSLGESVFEESSVKSPMPYALSSLSSSEVIRQLASSTVDLDISFDLTIISDETVVSTLLYSVNSDLDTLFVNDAFATYLVSYATSEGLQNNITVLSNASSSLLATYASDFTVLVIRTIQPTQSPSIAPTKSPILAPTKSPSVTVEANYDGYQAAASVTVMAVATTVTASITTSVMTSVGASAVASSAGASAGGASSASVASSSASPSSSSGGGGGGGGANNGGSTFDATSSNTNRGGTSNLEGDPLTLILLIQGIAVMSKLSNMPQVFTDGFAASFNMFNLKVCFDIIFLSSIIERHLSLYPRKLPMSYQHLVFVF